MSEQPLARLPTGMPPCRRRRVCCTAEDLQRHHPHAVWTGRYVLLKSIDSDHYPIPSMGEYTPQAQPGPGRAVDGRGFDVNPGGK